MNRSYIAVHSILSTKGDLEPIKRARVHAALAVEWPARSTCAIKACEAGAAVVSPLQVKTWRLMQTEVACPRWSCPLVAEPMPDAPVVWDLVDNVLLNRSSRLWYAPSPFCI